MEGATTMGRPSTKAGKISARNVSGSASTGFD
jgi:hypothetical protein